MKWIDVLCANCNNRRTQSHDRAWEEFSRELLSDVALLVPGATILLSNILGVDYGHIMLGVHHYLAKAFGCLAAQEPRFAAKIDLAGLGQSIREGRAYPALFFDIGVPPRVSNGPIVSASDPQLYLNPYDGSCGLATWFYNVNGVCALVAYAPGMAGWARAQGLWHPSFGMDRMVVKNFMDDSQAEFAAPLRILSDEGLSK